MTTTLPLPDGFELSAAQDFYRGFKPGEGMAAAGQTTNSLTFTFLVEPTFEPAEVTVTQRERCVVIEVTPTTLSDAAVRQVVRMLGLDADAGEWHRLGAREPIVGKLQASFPGFFTAAFPSPYEAGVGGLIAQRMSMAQAATLRRRLCEALGEKLPQGLTLPTPRRLLELRELPGLPPVKVERLHALARAALDGRLLAERLRGLGGEAAVEELQRLPGIGPWTAEHMFARGAAPFDFLPTAEPRVMRGAALACGVEALTPRRYAALAERWRPFRMWVAILGMRNLARAGRWSAEPDDVRGRQRSLRAAATATRSSAVS